MAAQQLDDVTSSMTVSDAVTMKVSKAVADFERRYGESQNERDARVEYLWTRLDPANKGELDLKSLQKAFRRIDHRESGCLPSIQRAATLNDLVSTALKNADDLLKQIMREVDTNKDGKIQYEGAPASIRVHM